MPCHCSQIAALNDDLSRLGQARSLGPSLSLAAQEATAALEELKTILEEACLLDMAGVEPRALNQLGLRARAEADYNIGAKTAEVNGTIAAYSADDAAYHAAMAAMQQQW